MSRSTLDLLHFCFVDLELKFGFRALPSRPYIYFFQKYYSSTPHKGITIEVYLFPQSIFNHSSMEVWNSTDIAGNTDGSILLLDYYWGRYFYI